MKQYHKIQTIYLRNPKTNYKTLLEGEWSKPEFEYLKNNEWEATEKIDGTNIRVIWNENKLFYKGKTDKANIPSFLLETLQKIFTVEKMEKYFKDVSVCLYGEGYGKKIQMGHNYIPDNNNFILFDVKIEGMWLKRDDVYEIGNKLEISSVPILGYMTLLEAVEYVKKGFKSIIAHNINYDAEGLVLRPKVQLFDRKGNRIITKIKCKDFKNE